MSVLPNQLAFSADFEFAALELAVNYRAALLREFAPYLKGRVLEIGAGIGQITAALAAVPAVQEVVAVEPEARFCEQFRRLHPQLKLIPGTIASLGSDSEWDSLVCINVLEHICDDLGELTAFQTRLAPCKGYLNLFVPARAEIYAPIDRSFGHFRRYNKPQLRRLLEDAGFEIIRLDYFNLVGYFAWWLNFVLRKKQRFDAGSVALFDRSIFPAMHWLERKVIRPPFGQSLIAVARAQTA